MCASAPRLNLRRANRFQNRADNSRPILPVPPRTCGMPRARRSSQDPSECVADDNQLYRHGGMKRQRLP
jgi:hypothetical protein